MKWFKHNSDAYSNLKLQKFRKIFGIEGYGFYWICCELVAQQKQDKEYIIKKEKNWKDWLEINTDIPIEKIDTFLQKMAEINLIDKESLERGHLSIPKMTEYSDDYSKRAIRTLSEQGNDSVRTVFGKSRVDKSILNKIYMSYQQLINKNSRLVDKAIDKIKTRLKSYSEEELKRAMENFSKSKWWMEHNAGRGVAWFFNSDERIDQFLNLEIKSEGNMIR